MLISRKNSANYGTRKVRAFDISLMGHSTPSPAGTLWRARQVLHGADSDVLWLQRDFGLYLVNMFDTGQASRVLRPSPCFVNESTRTIEKGQRPKEKRKRGIVLSNMQRIRMRFSVCSALQTTLNTQSSLFYAPNSCGRGGWGALYRLRSS